MAARSTDGFRKERHGRNSRENRLPPENMVVQVGQDRDAHRLPDNLSYFG